MKFARQQGETWLRPDYANPIEGPKEKSAGYMLAVCIGIVLATVLFLGLSK